MIVENELNDCNSINKNPVDRYVCCGQFMNGRLAKEYLRLIVKSIMEKQIEG